MKYNIEYVMKADEKNHVICSLEWCFTKEFI